MSTFDLVCLSHLRWDFVYQRPHHLLSRFARHGRVVYVEEPLPLPPGEVAPRLELAERAPNLTLIVPRVPQGVVGDKADDLLAPLLAACVAKLGIRDFVLWYYTPMALGLARALPPPLASVYDCMDELSAFSGAPPDLVVREAELLLEADLVFTGGLSLYEAKRRQHSSVHAFPSSVEVGHFAQARAALPDPSDQAPIPGPRLGFFGVLDERLDTDLLGRVADLRPEWQIVLIGPVAKIDPGTLPRRPNIHYLGPKPYSELPAYLAGWQVAMLPFARNAATRFISPTKTPEYLAAGPPIVSTSIRDVVRPYAEQGLVRIADEPAAFVAAAEAGMREDAADRLRRADAFLAGTSWDCTWLAMDALVRKVISRRLQPVGAVGLAQAV